MSEGTAVWIAIMLAIVGFFACMGIASRNETPDPIALRINAVNNATAFMSHEAKERLLMEVLKGNTNSVEVILERTK